MVEELNEKLREFQELIMARNVILEKMNRLQYIARKLPTLVVESVKITDKRDRGRRFEKPGRIKSCQKVIVGQMK